MRFSRRTRQRRASGPDGFVVSAPRAHPYRDAFVSAVRRTITVAAFPRDRWMLAAMVFLCGWSCLRVGVGLARGAWDGEVQLGLLVGVSTAVGIVRWGRRT